MNSNALRAGRNVVWTLIDGCHAETFYSLLLDGSLPNFRKMLENGTIVKKAYTCFPSVTVVCLASSFTGNHFKNHGILGNVWYDRAWNPVGGRAYLSVLDETLASYDRRKIGFPHILLPENYRGGLVNNDLSHDVKTIYETLTGQGMTSCAMFNYVGKGATCWFRPTRKNMLTYAYIDKIRHDYSFFDRQMMDGALYYLRKRGVPHLLTLYFGGNDGNSHHSGLNAQAEYLKKVIDVQMGRLIKYLETKKPLDEYHFIVSADHGQTSFPRSDGQHHILWIDHIRKIFAQSGMRLRVDGGEKGNVQPDSDILFAIGTGGSFSVYVKNRKTGRWQDSPGYEEDIVPIANILLISSDPQFYLHSSFIDNYLSFLVVRESPGKPYMIYSNDYPYTEPGTLIPLEDFFQDKTQRYPDAVSQIRGLESPNRGPDVIAVLDYDVKGFYFAKSPHKGNHGHLCEDDSRIPLVFAGPGVRKGELETARLIDIAPTVASIFGLDMPTADGKALEIFE